ncbi:hypothetical protein BH11PSE3_BH11PSE3_42920 [soil metagenome]
MRKIIIAAIGVVVLAALAVAAVPVLETHAAGQVKAAIERDGATKVGQVEVGLFDRRITLRDLTSHGAAEFTLGRWEASGLAWPLSELLAGRTPLAGFNWGDPLQANHVELQDLRLVDPAAGNSWSMDRLVIDDLDLARFDATYEGPYRLQALIARALGALTVRRLEERNVIFTLGSADTIGMALLVADRYERGRIASMAVGNLEATAKKGDAPLYSIADITAGGIDLSRVIAALSSDQWYPGAPVGRVHLEKASASGFAGDMLKRYGVSLGSITFETVRESETLSRSRTRIEGFVLAPSMRGLEGLQVRMALQTMGVREVKADFDCVGTEDRANGELALERCALTSPGLGDIGLSGHVVGADADFWQAVDDGDTLALADSKAALGSAQLVLADKSLLERSLKALATVTGQPVATTRANMARDIKRYQPSGVLISQSLTQLLDTVARFVEQGGTLTIEAKPEPPVGFDKLEYLVSPGADLVSLLGLKATLSR